MCERVDLEVLRARAVKIRELEAALLRVMSAQIADTAGIYFCDTCGRISPPCNFYPLWSWGPDSISGLTCLDCGKELRADEP
jgi:hypothetical protein